MFYDQKGLASAARGWWLMGLFGHDQAAVLDGGLPKWLREGPPDRDRRTGRASPRRRSCRTSAPPGCAALATCMRNVAVAVGTGARRARRRPLHRRRARAARRNALRPHPGVGERAVHRSAERGRNVPPGQRSARPASPNAGVDGSRPVVTSCGSGVTACILTLGLRLAGLPEGAVYDGSWTEWGGRSDTPVETN